MIKRMPMTKINILVNYLPVKVDVKSGECLLFMYEWFRVRNGVASDRTGDGGMGKGNVLDKLIKFPNL